MLREPFVIVFDLATLFMESTPQEVEEEPTLKVLQEKVQAALPPGAQLYEWRGYRQYWLSLCQELKKFGEKQNVQIQFALCDTNFRGLVSAHSPYLIKLIDAYITLADFWGFKEESQQIMFCMNATQTYIYDNKQVWPNPTFVADWLIHIAPDLINFESRMLPSIARYYQPAHGNTPKLVLFGPAHRWERMRRYYTWICNDEVVGQRDFNAATRELTKMSREQLWPEIKRLIKESSVPPSPRSLTSFAGGGSIQSSPRRVGSPPYVIQQKPAGNYTTPDGRKIRSPYEEPCVLM